MRKSLRNLLSPLGICGNFGCTGRSLGAMTMPPS